MCDNIELMTKLKKGLMQKDILLLVALFIIILLLLLIFFKLSPSILYDNNLQTKITISPSIIPNVNNIINLKIPELQASENIVKLKGEDIESFTIYINPRRGFSSTNIINETDININNSKYKKILLFNPENKKVDIFLIPIDNLKLVTLEIIANLDKEDISVEYGYKIIKALQE